MDLEKITFWYGCNVLRHRDIIHGCLDILRAIGFDPAPVGGPDYCCGTVKDANQVAAGGMATRTVGKLNARQRRVITWCPSCHSHMHDFMGQANERQFDLTYLVELLHANREKLAPLLVRPVPMRVMLHKHVGFNEFVPVNRLAPELLRMIPGVQVVQSPYVVPGYMCTSFLQVPKAMDDIHSSTVAAARTAGADAVVTIFHQCYRELIGLDTVGAVPIYNYIHLICRSMGIEYDDDYKAWKKNPERVGEKRIAQVGVEFFDRAILPELRKRPTSYPKPDGG